MASRPCNSPQTSRAGDQELVPLKTASPKRGKSRCLSPGLHRAVLVGFGLGWSQPLHCDERLPSHLQDLPQG